MTNRLYAHLRTGARLRGTVRLTDSVTEALPSYAGPYTAVPAANTQTLSTRGKKMTADVTLAPIPLREIANESGGITLIIGG